MKTITLTFLLFITIFFGYCSLSSMQNLEDSYEKFLEQRNEQAGFEQKLKGPDKVFNFKKELENGFILETRVSLYIVERESRLFGTKEIINSKLNRDQGLIASLDYIVCDKKSPGQCECSIEYLETKKAHQKKGYATQLLINLEDELKQLGVRLNITLKSLPSKIDFYSKRGFIPTEKSDKSKKSKQLEMHKELNGLK